MVIMSNSDYILVKDKDGKLKYYKDGKYFEIDEIDGLKNGEPKKKERTLHDIDLSAKHDEEVDKFAHLDESKKEVDVNVKKAIEAILTDLKVKFTDESTKKKFESLLLSRLRNVRNDKETTYMLTVPKDDGGLGLDEKRAGLVLTVIKKHLVGLDESTKNVVEKVKMPEKGTLYENKGVRNTKNTEPKAHSSFGEEKYENLSKHEDKDVKVGEIKNTDVPAEEVYSRKSMMGKVEKKKEVLADSTKAISEDKKGKINGAAIIDDLIARSGGGLTLEQIIKDNKAKDSPVQNNAVKVEGELKDVKVEEKKKEVLIEKNKVVVSDVKEASTDLQDTTAVITKEVKVEKVEEKKVEVQKPKPKVELKPVIEPVRKAVKNDNSVGDVAFKQQLYSPVDELKTMDIVNFRRLGGNIKEVIIAIEEKIENLREESWGQGMIATKAWKESPVLGLYRDMGVQSMISGKTINEVIVDRQIKNELVLTQSEFEGVLDFNKKLSI